MNRPAGATSLKGWRLFVALFLLAFLASSLVSLVLGAATRVRSR